MNKAQKYADSKNPEETSEDKSLLRGYYKKKMSNEEILLQACEKAIENGYTPPMDMQIQMGIQGYRWNLDTYIEWYPRVIFSHDFAKAFFGEEIIHDCGKEKHYMWQYELQQMVISEDPLAYLEKYL